MRATSDPSQRGEGPPAPPSRPVRRAGFTLLEVMAAFVLAALTLSAVSASSSSAVVNAARAYRQNVAAMLIRGVVLDIEEEYAEDGFPDGDKRRDRCKVPKAFSRTYRCEYDLHGLDIDPGTMGEVAMTAMANLFGGGGGGGPGGGGRKGKGGGGDDGGMPDIGGMDPGELASRLEGSLSGQAGAMFAMIAANPMILEVCNLNIQQAIMNAQMSAAFFPTIVEKAAEVTRKLTVRLSWSEGKRSRKRQEMVIETFIVAIPEDEETMMKQMGRAEDAGLLEGDQPGMPGMPGQPGMPGMQPGMQPGMPGMGRGR